MSNTNSGEGGTLVALYPILHHSHLYKVGEALPVNDADMVAAWLEAGTAKWTDGEEGDTVEASKAVPVTAEPGRTGRASDGNETDGDDLAGKVPKTKQRKK